jgi:hypothetical protein
MRGTILSFLAALALLSAVPSAALAKGDKDERRREEVVARLKKARAENRRVIISLRKGYGLTGRVGEIRERGFTFEPDNKDDAELLKGAGMVAAIFYEDVTGVRHPSKMREFFKGVRTGLVGTGAFFVVMPIYGVQALLGNLPGC